MKEYRVSRKHEAGPHLVLFFLVVFLFVPLAQLNFLSMMPGDIGDARLNNYFLENVFQFLTGRGESLWHLSFFRPFPYVSGFSETLFGSSPLYVLARALGAGPETGFQVWFLGGYVANFLAAYYALSKLGNSPISSAVGALVFAFALPVTAHAGHAQLHYRFGVPLSIAAFIVFLDKKVWWYLVAAGAWLVWQFYCSIYIGFFAFLMLAALFFTYTLMGARSKIGVDLLGVKALLQQWHAQTRAARLGVVVALLLLLSFLVVLFFPYLRVTQLYGATRSLGEIASMLPRPQSYFLSDGSWLWSSESQVFAGLPMRHEHQMFVGAVPLVLAVVGLVVGSRERNGIAFPLLIGALVGVVLLTLYVGGRSLWYLFAKLPVASAIRAMTRVDQVLLFPIAYLGAVAVDGVGSRLRWGARPVLAIVLLLLTLEVVATSPIVSSKSEWRQRLSENEASLPSGLPADAILFFAQSRQPFFASELDAMWVALEHGADTMNGYSGFYPPGFSTQYGVDCSEVPKRALSYLNFAEREGDVGAYRTLLRRIVPIGFLGCDDRWWSDPPRISIADRSYSPEDLKRLSIEYRGRRWSKTQWVVDLRIRNDGDQILSAMSSKGTPIRVSWRFADASGTPASGWDARKDLAFDVLAHDTLDVQVFIAPEMAIANGELQVSFVQEGVFWAHDIGVEPLRIRWD